MTETRSTIDPRTQLTDAELSAAAINALPQVARQSSAADNLGLAAGMTGALMLGGIAFYMLQGGQTPPPAPVPAPVEAVVAPPPVAPAMPAPVVAPPQPIYVSV